MIDKETKTKKMIHWLDEKLVLKYTIRYSWQLKELIFYSNKEKTSTNLVNTFILRERLLQDNRIPKNKCTRRKLVLV